MKLTVPYSEGLSHMETQDWSLIQLLNRTKKNRQRQRRGAKEPRVAGLTKSVHNAV
jgi:hypothetical protein